MFVLNLSGIQKKLNSRKIYYQHLNQFLKVQITHYAHTNSKGYFVSKTGFKRSI